MKNLLLLLLSLLSSSIIYAQSGDCVIFSPDGEYFYLALDNKFQNVKAHKNIKIKNIPEGDYWLTILFFDKNKKAIKRNIKLRAAREISYQLAKQDDGNWGLAEYSNVSKAQVKTMGSSQMVLSYNATGIEVEGIKSADKIASSAIQNRVEPSRIQGLESKRQGKFSSSEPNKTTTTTPTATAPKADPKTGTSILIEYVKIDNSDGTNAIVERRTTVYKEIVEKNGQRFLRTRKDNQETPTDFTCLPLLKEAFLALKETVSQAENKSEAAQTAVKNQCMTPAQIKAIGDLISDDNARNDFAIIAKNSCASPSKFPYTIKEPVLIAAVETVPEAKEAVSEPKEVPKTKAELKAELKAAKAREKAAKKAARAAKKAAKKAEREAKKAAKKAAKKSV